MTLGMYTLRHTRDTQDLSLVYIEANKIINAVKTTSV